MGSSRSGRPRRAVSVVVPTRDRPESLSRCLRALERQSDVDSLEIIVVDDGSVQREAVADAVARSPSARLLRIENAGPAAARNAGAERARHPFVLFVDDDCEPVETWAARLAEALEHGADVAAGSSVNPSPGAIAAASQTIFDFLGAEYARRPGIDFFAPSNNLGCKREVVAAVQFDERYGTLPGEDRDWCARIVAAGYTVAPVPDAVVAHRQGLTLGSFWRKHVGYGRGSYRFRREWSRPLESPAYYARLLRGGFAGGVATGLLIVLAQAATAVGYAREARALHGRR